MNKLQCVQLDILKEFIRICQTLDLKYYLICGSALGCAKYKGFIPWDDDVDVALPRKDYDIFLEKAQALLPEYYFLQNYKTDKYFHHFCSKIRDSRTTYIEKDQKNLNIHHGVFIDVIPLDILPDDKNFKIKYRIFRIFQLIHLKSPEKYKNSIKFILKPFANITPVYRHFEHYLRENSSSGNVQYCNFHNAKNNRLYMDFSYYGEGTTAKFEGLDVIIPEKYDEYLTAYYGDWRADLPTEQQIGHHYVEVIDLETPYTAYVEKRRNGIIRIKG